MTSLILKTFVILLISCKINYVESARILGVFPCPSVSHQAVFRAFIDKLAERGHDIVTVTPVPVNNHTRKNVREIDTSYTYDIFAQTWVSEELMKSLKRGVIVGMDTLVPENHILFTPIAEATFKNHDLQKILKDKSQKFDLIITEVIYPYFLVLSEKIKAPLILFSSFYGFIENYNAAGAPSIHPLIYSHPYRQRLFDLSLNEKFQELQAEYRLRKFQDAVIYHQDLLLKEHFPEVKKSLYELMDNVDMLFVNSNPIFEGNRPVPPNVIFLGALHMKPAKPLSKELQDYLDSSKRGVIYISLGTNVRTAVLAPELCEAFLGTIEALPYDVLWKFEGELPRKPKNLRLEKWFPQRDLLFHPKIKAFVTQGGLQSTDEAIDAGVPLVGIPILVDQWYNVEHYVRLGIGVKVDSYIFQAEDLIKAVNTVIDDPSYHENIVRLRTLMKDQPETPLERAVWWTEYVIRNKGAKHLKALTANMSWWIYLEVELLSVVFGAILAVIAALITAIVVVKRLVTSMFSKKCSKKSIKNKQY